jgi:ankyrin repeat protein
MTSGQSEDSLNGTARIKLRLDDSTAEKTTLYEYTEDDYVLFRSEDKSMQRQLLHAAQHGQEIAVKQLLEKGGFPDRCTDEEGKTAFSYAVANGHDTVVKLLLKYGAFAYHDRNPEGRTPLSYAAENGHDTVMRFLLDIPLMPDDLSSQAKKTPLLYAAQNGHETIVKMLLDHTVPDITPEAKLWHHRPYAKQDQNWDELMSARTPLSYAAENGYEKIAKLLLDNRAEPDFTYNAIIEREMQEMPREKWRGRTPLSYAAEKGHKVVVQLLIEKGANPNSSDQNGRTPLSYAIENGQHDIGQLLEEHGAKLVPQQ